MTVLTETSRRTRRPTVARPRARRGAALRTPARERGDATLEDLVIEIWAGVESGRADCPVCTGQQLSSSGCADCGASLT